MNVSMFKEMTFEEKKIFFFFFFPIWLSLMLCFSTWCSYQLFTSQQMEDSMNTSALARFSNM